MQYRSFRRTNISKLNFASGRTGRTAGPASSTLVKLSLNKFFWGKASRNKFFENLTTCFLPVTSQLRYKWPRLWKKAIMSGFHSCRDSIDKSECEGYIRLIFHTLDLFSSRLKALGYMSVKQSRGKGNENVSNVLPHYRWFSHKSANVYINVYFVSFTSHQMSRRVPETRMETRHNAWFTFLSRQH